jgi:molybdenum cofactor guanylyltransferase
MKNKPQKSIAAIILAGGKSTRMGQDKALLTINNCSLLTHVCTVAQDSLNWVYVVTPWVVKYQDLIPANVRLIEETIVLPHTESNCPLIGFYQGLQQVNTEWVLLLACDLPKLNSEAIQQWCQYLNHVSDSEIALLPKSEKGWEPLCGFYRRSCLPLIEAYLNRGGKSFQQWLAQHPVRELPISDRSVLFNCNTWEDWLVVSG